MKIAYSWLQDYVKTNKTPAQIQELLTFHTAEIESVQTAGQIDNVVIGKVETVVAHPNADKLKIAQVDVGSEKSLRIVCGAPNLEAGQLVPVALPGAVLPGGLEIAERAVRGENSQGMICATDELGLGGDHAGIMVLPEASEIGAPFVPAGGEAVLDVAVPANRPDLMSHLGIAREIAAVDKLEFIEKKYSLPEISSPEQALQVEVDPELCPRYSALLIGGVKVGPSPDWLRQRLEAIGLRSINNIVDLTNYLMFDWGQPLHTFDFDKVAGSKMTIRPAKKTESLQTLDGQKWQLQDGMPVISDAEKVIDLAGIMGGQNSEVTEATVNIVLQAANFAPVPIRKTSRALGHRTDAVAAYEKGIDPNLTIPTLAKAWALLAELSPGVSIRQLIDEYNSPADPVVINFDPALLKKIIGLDITATVATEILQRLGLDVRGEETLAVTIPTWRGDLKLPQDLVEEVVRVIGYDKVPVTMPVGELRPPDSNSAVVWERKAKTVLVAAGFNEVVNYSFTSRRDLEALGTDLKGYLKVANPISPENNFMRASLVPGLLKNVKENLKNFEEFNLFEIGNVFYGYDKTEELKYEEAAHEEPKITGVMVNNRPRQSIGKVRSRSFLEAKGVVEEILQRFGITETRATYEQIKIPNATFHPGRTAVVRVKVKGAAELEGEYSEEIGVMGEVHPALLAAYGIESVVMVFDLNFQKLKEIATEFKPITTIGKYPGVTRDVALVVDRGVLVGEVKAVMGNAGGELIEKVDLFDTYEGDQVPDSKKSLAFHVLYQLPDRTLTDKEVDDQHQQVITAVKDRYQATVRE
jgi:phenylalanyl-tRNA synthetase beta chain